MPKTSYMCESSRTHHGLNTGMDFWNSCTPYKHLFQNIPSTQKNVKCTRIVKTEIQTKLNIQISFGKYKLSNVSKFLGKNPKTPETLENLELLKDFYIFLMEILVFHRRFWFLVPLAWFTCTCGRNPKTSKFPSENPNFPKVPTSAIIQDYNKEKITTEESLYIKPGHII